MISSGEQGGAGHLGTIRSSSARTGMLIYNSLLTSQIIVVKNGPDIAYQDVTMLHHSRPHNLVSYILWVAPGIPLEFQKYIINIAAPLPKNSPMPSLTVENL